jgi:1-deoxy-D-xylulose-5-phosphate synthase
VALLPGISGPADVQRLDPEQLPVLAAEIRDLLISSVSRTGGHLGPNLGAVELTIALHRVFTSPRDRILFDTGHQTYVHKMLTGRSGQFDTLRKEGGLSGYPSAAESEHDVIENSHASTALSYADGLAKAYRLRGEQRPVIAVVGDGALTGGMCWEALNNIAASDRQVIIVVNDNGRSYAPTIGGLATHLANLRLNPQYEHVLEVVRGALSRTPLVGAPLYEALHGIKRGLKDLVQPQVMFEDLGLKYVGPVDGHDVAALEPALRSARDFGGPVIVHCVTRKGFGYRPAEDDEADRFHGVGVIDPLTGKPLVVPTARTWTSAFGDEIVRLGTERENVVAITAAMLEPVGLGPFAAAFPDRVFDVGIAEQHAVTSATGLAMGGMRPVVCVYATFLNRAFDQVLLDVALHRQPVVFVLDRAGVTGDDGPSHNGMWDLSWLPIVPGLVAFAPRDEPTLRAALRDSLDRNDGPSVVRFPKGALPSEVPVVRRLGAGPAAIDVLHEPRLPADEAGRSDVLLVSYGAMAATALEVAERVEHQGIGVRVVDPRRICPVDDALVDLARSARLVVTLEDNGRAGGAGATLAAALRAAEVDVPVRDLGLDSAFLAQGKRDAILTAVGLSAQAVARRIVEAVARYESDLQPAPDG